MSFNSTKIKSIAIGVALTLSGSAMALGGVSPTNYRQTGILIGNTGVIVQSKQQAVSTLIGQWQILKTSSNSRYANISSKNFIDFRLASPATIKNLKLQYPDDPDLVRVYQRQLSKQPSMLTAMCVARWGGNNMTRESFIGYDNYATMAMQLHLIEFNELKEQERLYRKQCESMYKDNSFLFVSQIMPGYGLKNTALVPFYRFNEDMLSTYRSEVQTNLYIKSRFNGFDLMKSSDLRLGDDISIDIVNGSDIIIYDFMRGSNAGGWAYLRRVAERPMMSRSYSLRKYHNQEEPVASRALVGTLDQSPNKVLYQGVFD
ncbi:hypothetical protein [Photobacterium damselae]|uniref:hypothetical protein n=1 Tax=Photobacterium damselae TaxID=38293 RepID=UPI000D66317A|nr:hypothetical protein [Photobacterium damselae]AWK84631.1 hypothetical protein BST98_21630 [Photobacterium damselae]TLS84320.1 hypothetical protein FD720_17375 [Photobacterium damselae subsp. damselae]